MSFTAQLLRLACLPVATAIFLFAAQASGGLVVRDDATIHLAQQ